jgi:hypothetical protein
MDATAPLPTPETKNERPLLPAVLSGPAAFLWLWVLPMAVLLLLNLQGFWLIEGNMDQGQRDKAVLFGFSGLVNLLVGVVLYVVARRPGQNSDASLFRQAAWGLPAIAVQIAYLWLAVVWMSEILPVSVTVWIYPPERFLFNQFAFAMLPLFLGILRLACARPATGIGKVIAVNLGLAVAAPVLLYVAFQAFRFFDTRFEFAGIIVATGIIALGLVMFFGLIRASMLALRHVQKWGATAERIAIVFFALVMPLGGLALNRGIPFPVDFQAWEVYALVVGNTAILLLASRQHASWPRLSYCLLCATFPFSLYFFIVFLPYTPLSILAVIAAGAGFLVLTPTFLFILHLHLLHKAHRHVLPGQSRLRLTLVGLLCCLLLPAFFTVRGLADKAALHAALDYVFAPTIESGTIAYPGSQANLRRALRNHRSYKNGIYYPLLSDYYSWLVFDNLVLPDDKLARLENTFVGAAGSTQNTDALRSRGNFFGERSVRDRTRMPRATPPPRTVEVSRLDVSARSAGDQNSVVTLALTLQNAGQIGAEYQKTLPLPAGIFVNGFRLHIDGVPVPGRIFEKKTALWVYTMIRDSERRDPGLLFYNTPDELELRVFPVNPGKPTTVEIEFLAPGTFTTESVAADSKDPAVVLAQWGRLLRPQIARDARDNVVASGLGALPLPMVEREPYLHLIVDRSVDNGFAEDLATAVRHLKAKFPAAHQARVTLANYNVIDLVTPLTSLDELTAHHASDLARALPPAGGCAMDLALAHALRQHCELDLDRISPTGGVPPRPVFVILSRKAVTRTLEIDVTRAWADLLPVLEIHELGVDGTLTTLQNSGYAATPLLRLGDSVRPLVAGLATRFKATGESDRLEYWSPETSAWRPVAGATTQLSSGNWSRAVSLQLQQQDQVRDPGGSGIDLKTLVKASRESGVLLAATSYIVVENSAQWRMLESSERQKLGQNTALSFRETPAPPALIVAFGFGLWLALRRRRQKVTAAAAFGM